MKNKEIKQIIFSRKKNKKWIIIAMVLVLTLGGGSVAAVTAAVLALKCRAVEDNFYQSDRSRTGGAGGSWNYAIRAAVQRESVLVGTGCSIVAVVWCRHRKHLRLLSGV